MSTQIVVFPRGQLSEEDKERMAAVDILAVEADDPRQVVCVVPGAPMVGASDLFMAALTGLSVEIDNRGKAAFTNELLKRLRAKETP